MAASRLSPVLDRRGFLLGAGGVALAAAAPAAAALPHERGFVASGSGRLRSVLVCAGEPAGCSLLAGGDPYWLDAAAELATHNAEMIAALEATGARVLRFEAVLDGAIGAARSRGRFDGWLASRFPELQAPGRAAAMTLLAHADGWRRNGHGSASLRDVAAMLPTGLVLTNSSDDGLGRYNEVLRFALRYAPELRHYPIAFDARTQRCRLEGGDVLVLDRRTLLVGVGRRTEAAAASALARETGLDVIAVALGREAGAPDHLDAAAVVLASDRVLLHRSVAGAAARLHRAGAPDLAGGTFAEQLRSRGLGVTIAAGTEALGLLSTGPGVVLAFAGSAAVPHGVAATRVGDDRAWLARIGPQRLALALERA